MSGSGTSSPLHPLGLTTVIVPDFSIGAVTSLLSLLKNGTTTTNGPQVAEVIELAWVLELKELEQEEVYTTKLTSLIKLLKRFSYLIPPKPPCGSDSPRAGEGSWEASPSCRAVERD